MRLARVTKVYREASQERNATEYNGAYAVDVVYVDSKLADTEETQTGVFLTMQSEDDYSYPDKGSIVGVDTYEGTSISFVDHITPFQKLVPGLQAGQHQIGDNAAHVLIDTEQRSLEIEADNVRVDGDTYKNSAGIQDYIVDQLTITSEYFTKIHSRGDIELIVLAFLNLQAGRFSITGTENSSITAIQNFNETVGLGKSSVIGLGDDKTVAAGNYSRELIAGLFDFNNPASTFNERLKAPFENLSTVHDNDLALVDLILALTVPTGTGPSGTAINAADFILHKAEIDANKALIAPEEAIIDLYAA